MTAMPPLPWENPDAVEAPSKDLPCGCGPERGFCKEHDRQPRLTALLRALRNLGR